MRFISHIVLLHAMIASLLLPIPGYAEISIERIMVGTNDWFPKASSSNPSSEVVRIKQQTFKRVLNFDIKSSPDTQRWRYQLEGVDTDWRDSKLESALSITCFNAIMQPILGKSFPIRESSRGWKGSVESSEYTSGHGELEISAPTDNILITISLSPNVRTCGLIGIDDLRMFIYRQGREFPEIFSLAPQGIDKTASSITPTNWVRAGSKREMAEIRTLSVPFPHPILVINDNDPNYFGLWNHSPENLSLQIGDKIRLEWKAAYSFGSGNNSRLTYREKLPLGQYRLKVAEALANGDLTGKVAVVNFEVVPQWYQNPLNWFLAALAAFIGLTFLIRHYQQIRMETRLVLSEKQRLLEAERTRIARDIHDDLGATLTQIAMLSEMARVQASADTAHSNQLENIFKRAHSATRKLDEIVWAINPSNDTTEHLVGYLCQFAEDYLKLANLEFRLDAPDTLPPATLSAGQRHHLFLVAKESLHNIVKHASASEVWLRIHVRDNRLIIHIEDNGCGFQQTETINSAHGSSNMRTRMAQIGGNYERTSQPGKGTTVILSIPV